MVLTTKQRKEFATAARVMMKYLGENHHPHVTVIIDNSRAEILELSTSIVTTDYIAD